MTHASLRARRWGAVRTVAYGVFAVVLATFFVASADAQVATGKGRLNGIVMDQAGNPIEGARVVLTHRDTGESWEEITDSDGRWLKGNMGRGLWTVDFYADGYKPSGVTVQVQEINRSKPVQTYLEPGEAAAAGPTGAFSGALQEAIKEGNALATAGDHAAALAHFEQVLVDFPIEDNQYVYLVHINAGNSAFELGDTDRAREHFEAVVAADSENAEARMALANMALASRDLDAAMAQLEQIDLDDIRDPITFYNIGSLLFEQGQSAEAQQYYERALALNPNFADAHMQVALCLIQQGDFAGSKDHLLKVVELDPGSQNAAIAQSFLDSPEFQD